MITTEEKGRGVVATRHFAQGEFVVEYIGELISDSEARAREAEYKKDPSVGSFMFFFAHGCVFLFMSNPPSRAKRLKYTSMRLEWRIFVWKRTFHLTEASGL